MNIFVHVNLDRICNFGGQPTGLLVVCGSDSAEEPVLAEVYIQLLLFRHRRDRHPEHHH